jgi:hypothetical protein
LNFNQLCPTVYGQKVTFMAIGKLKTKLHGLSLRVNYTGQTRLYYKSVAENWICLTAFYGSFPKLNFNKLCGRISGICDKSHLWSYINHLGCGTSHMSDNRQMSVAMQRLVDFISMVTNSTLLCNNTVTLLLAGFSVGRSICNSPLLCNG